jgi:hypothetical protein
MSTPDFGPRRHVLKAGFALLAGSFFARPARSQPANDDDRPKLARAAVMYRDTPGAEGRSCGSCTHCVAPGHCGMVAGEISQCGHCLSYTPNAAEF